MRENILRDEEEAWKMRDMVLSTITKNLINTPCEQRKEKEFDNIMKDKLLGDLMRKDVLQIFTIPEITDGGKQKKPENDLITEHL